MLKGEVWVVDLGDSNGCEQQGIRPCVIVQNDVGNFFSPTTIICPITRQNKNFNATHVELNCLRESSVVLCEQVRVIDKKRFKKYICTLDADCITEIESKLKVALGI